MTWTHLYNIMSEKNYEGRGMGRQQERLWQVGTSLVPCGFSLRLVEVECLCKMAPRSPLPCPWWSNWKSGCSGRHTEHFLIGKNLDEGQGWMFEKFFFPRHVFWGYCFALSPQRILSLFQNRIVMLLQPWLLECSLLWCAVHCALAFMDCIILRIFKL